jgi:hypothetical protein
MKSTQITSSTPGLQAKVQITRTGLQLTDNLTFSEWEAMAERFGAAMSSAAFVIGDWLVYGEDHFRGQGRLPGFEENAIPSRKVSGEIYEAALRLTGLDRTTLATYAYVARRVPPSLRNEQLSWEHHKAVARLEPHQQTKWLEIAMEEGGEGEAGPISTRRLRKSITAGRLLTRQEMQIDPADRGQPNHIPHLNRLWVWWLDLRESGWRKEATREQKDALKRDLGIVLQIIQEIG